MKKLRFYLAIIIANFCALCLKFFKKTAGTSFPGLIALKISPNFLQFVKNYCRKNIVNITGTNGKTTTSGYISSILKLNNDVIHNQLGANMIQGIVSTIALKLKPFKKYDYFVLETDEAFLTKVYDNLSGDYLLVTNLFRDQLDRYGELNTTKNMIDAAISKNKNLKLVLNADDPMVLTLGKNNQKIYFGFNEVISNLENNESKTLTQNVECPKCGVNLEYINRHYAHIGNYTCDCGFKRPQLTYGAKVTLGETSLIELNGFTYKIYQPGLYNAYNALAAICLAIEFGILPDNIQKSFDSYETIFGRNEKIIVDGKNVLIHLIKNPVGASEVLKSVKHIENPHVMVALNDNYADGRDVSWIFDADFELLNTIQNQISVSGKRADDMAVRLKYAGINENNIFIDKNLKSAFRSSLKKTKKGETLIIFPTYTALLEMQNFIKKG